MLKGQLAAAGTNNSQELQLELAEAHATTARQEEQIAELQRSLAAAADVDSEQSGEILRLQKELQGEATSVKEQKRSRS